MRDYRPHDSRLVRLVCAGVGLAGIVVPVLPTTPFILLAAACFARGSERFHAALLANHISGPLIREWHEHRAMPRQAKRVAYLLLALSFGVSILVMANPWHRLMLAALGLVLAYFLWSVPVRNTRLQVRRRPTR